MEEFFARVGFLMSRQGDYPYDHRIIGRQLLQLLIWMRVEAKETAFSASREPHLSSFYRGRWDGIKVGALMMLDTIIAGGQYTSHALDDITELFLKAVRVIEDHEFGTPEIKKPEEKKD